MDSKSILKELDILYESNHDEIQELFEQMEIGMLLKRISRYVEILETGAGLRLCDLAEIEKIGEEIYRRGTEIDKECFRDTIDLMEKVYNN
jgi:hypothetical protein